MREDFYKKNWFKNMIWLLIFVITLSMFNMYHNFKFSLIESSYTTIMLIIAHIMTIKLFIPYIKKYHNWKGFTFLFIIIITIIIFFTSFESKILSLFSVIPVHRPPYVGHFSKNLFQICIVFLVDIVILLTQRSTELLKREKQLQGEKLATELKLLKAQINPHFIFNALNNIYSLSYMKSDKAPDSILKLSEMLRYVFYDCSKDRVSLESEIKYIENFTIFQQIKSEEKQNIILNKKIKYGSYMVAPMLFIPFVENAFKYSNIEDMIGASVVITIEDRENYIIFDIVNTIPKESNVSSGNGLGLKNVKDRLNIIYPSDYDLKIGKEEGKFRVHLEIYNKNNLIK